MTTGEREEKVKMSGRSKLVGHFSFVEQPFVPVS